MKAIMQGFVGTTAEWEAKNPTLYKGVWAVEELENGSRRVKIGDGKTRWTKLKALGVEDIEGLTSSEAGLQTAVAEETARATDAEAGLQTAITEETARATDAETVLASDIAALNAGKIDKSVAGEAGTLMQSLEINEPTTNSVTAAYRSVDADTGAATETLVDLPVAGEEKAGMMPAESFRQIGENAARIAALENRAVHYQVVLAGEDPTQGELQQAYEQASGNAGPAPEQTTLDDAAFGKSYAWYETMNEWVDRGSSVISRFGNGKLGAIQGENADGKVFAENDGTGSVVGWSGLKARVGNVEETKAPIANPAFTGVPKVPNKTSAATSDGALIATEAQVKTVADSNALKAPIANPVFTGTPKVPSKTSAATSDGTLIATEAQVYLKADKASPIFTGTPKITDANDSQNRIAVAAATSNPNEANLPVGSYIILRDNGIIPPNSELSPSIYSTFDSIYYIGSLTQGSIPLSGTWRSCGAEVLSDGKYIIMCRRVA